MIADQSQNRRSKDLSDYPDVRKLLCRLALELINFRQNGSTSSSSDAIFREIEPDWPEIIQIVGGVSRFREEDEQTYWNITNQVDWINRDPSIISLMWARIYESFQGLTCPTSQNHRKPVCHCETLKRHYGTKIFKCCYPSCSLSRQGFATSEACKTHVDCETHSRAWKCSIQGCPYTVIGFSTSQESHNHWQLRHRIPKSSPVNTIQDELSAEFQVLLFEVTKSGDIEAIQRLVPHIAAHNWDVEPAILLAAARGWLPIVQVLTDCTTWLPKDADLYKAIMRGENPDILLWFLNTKCDKELWNSVDAHQWLAREAVATTSPDMYAVWESFFLDPDRGLPFAYPYRSGDPHMRLPYGWRVRVSRSTRKLYRSSVLFSSATFVAAMRSSLFEVRLVHTWHKLINDVLGGETLNRRFLGQALFSLARLSNPSITLATELLRLGAHIDFARGRASNSAVGASISKNFVTEQDQESYGHLERLYNHKHHQGFTVLHAATRGTSEQTAQLVRLLLEQGAEPTYGWVDRKPATERGVAILKKWIGETWEELVERTTEARLEKRRRLAKLYGEVYDSIDDDDEGEDEGSEEGANEEKQETARGTGKGKGKGKEESRDEGEGESSIESSRKRRKTDH